MNGFLLLAFERLRRRPPQPGDYLGDSNARIAKLSWRQAIGMGTAQAAALVPGISRSGITMGGGLLFGLSNEDAARYAFLLVTAIIGAAGVVKLPPQRTPISGAAACRAGGRVSSVTSTSPRSGWQSAAAAT